MGDDGRIELIQYRQLSKVGTGEKTALSEKGSKGVILYNQEKAYSDLKTSGGIGGRRSTEGQDWGTPVFRGDDGRI